MSATIEPLKTADPIPFLLERQTDPHRPSLENRVAFQWELQGDLLGQRNGGLKDRLTVDWLAEAVRDSATPAAVLDIGCAYGNMLLMLNAKLGKPADARFVGVDLYPGSIEYARAFAQVMPGYANCSYQVADLVKGLPFSDGEFAAVNMGDVLEHMDDPAAAMRELIRVTRPGGRILISTPLRDGLFKKVASLVNTLSAGKLYRSYYQGKDTNIGNDGKPVMVSKAGNDHVSEMNWAELQALFSSVGLKTRRVRMMPVMSGSRWFDRHPFLLSGLLFLEAVHDLLQIPSWAHGVIVELEKPLA